MDGSGALIKLVHQEPRAFPNQDFSNIQTLSHRDYSLKVEVVIFFIFIITFLDHCKYLQMKAIRCVSIYSCQTYRAVMKEANSSLSLLKRVKVNVLSMYK